jgi:hypothetical protein
MLIVTWATLGWSTVLPGTAQKTYVDPNYQALPWDVRNALESPVLEMDHL